MDTVTAIASQAKTLVTGQPSAPQTEEPQSGVTGKGTVDSPYDQGNTEQNITSTEEPPAGITGKGTISSPYDQGNAPEQPEIPNIVVENAAAGQSTVNDASGSSLGAPKLPSPADPLASPSTTHQGSGNPLAEPTPEQEQVIHESRGRDEKAQHTTSTISSTSGNKTQANSGHFDPAKTDTLDAKKTRYERSVSPGQLPDGSHVRCSGDKGQAYTPGNKLSDKIKDRFHFHSKKS